MVVWTCARSVIPQSPAGHRRGFFEGGPEPWPAVPQSRSNFSGPGGKTTQRRARHAAGMNVRCGSLADAATMSALSPVLPDKRTSAYVSGASVQCH